MSKNLVHFRFKFSGRNIRIVVISIAVNTQGVGFWEKLKTILQTIKNERTVRVVKEFIFRKVEINQTILKLRDVNNN